MGAYRRPTYVYSEPQVPGVLTAANHLSLTNPAGSGKVITIGGVFISQVTEGEVSGTQPMRGYLATGVSGGTLEDASTIAKAVSTLPTPVGQIRTGNVTATLGAAWFNSPAFRATGAATAPFVHQIPAGLPGGYQMTLLPGESTVLRTEAGDTDQRWNLSIAWLEG